MTVSTRADSRQPASRRGRRSRQGQARSLPARAGAALRTATPALAVYLAARITTLTVVLLASPHAADTTFHLLATHWDANWYLDIARYGYDDSLHPTGAGGPHQSNLAFFPLFPWLMTALHTVLPFLPWAAAGPLVATLASFAAAWGIFASVRPGFGQRTATLTVALWGIAPASVIENAGYSESLFTALAAWTLWALVTRRWLTAGLLAVLAGLTRPTAVAVVAAVVLLAAREVLRASRGDRDPGDGPLRRPVTAALLAPLGWLGYVVWSGLRVGSLTGYFEIQAQWHSRFDFGAATLNDLGLVLGSHSALAVYLPVNALILVGALALLVLAALRRQPLPFLVYCAVILVVTLGDSAFFSSRPRFLLPAFPLLVPAAVGLDRLRSRPLAYLVLASLAVAFAGYGAYAFFVSPGAP